MKVSKELGGGGSVRTEPLRQLLDDFTHKRKKKRKVGKPKILLSFFVMEILTQESVANLNL